MSNRHPYVTFLAGTWLIAAMIVSVLGALWMVTL